LANEIIADAGGDETKVALTEDGELVELYIENNNAERLVGSIYRGRVVSVLPGMQSAFVDIGYEKNAFLYVDDAIQPGEFSDEDAEVCREREPEGLSIEKILKPGQAVTVQVIKSPAGAKGPRVTSYVSLPGRNLVLLPNADYVGVSRRIENEAGRVKLKKIAEKLKPKGMGLIIRTASEGMRADDFKHDLQFLTDLWNGIKRKEKRGRTPRCLHMELNLVLRAVRDMLTGDIGKFVINNWDWYARAVELAEKICPKLKCRIEYFGKDADIFEHYGIKHQISRALAKKIWLKCGGYLVIDRTEALTAIDVNTGKYTGEASFNETILKTNLEAAEEIAKQLRLRDIGGIIIIDFIDMHKPEHQLIVMNALKSALKKDRTKTSVVGMTGLGLIEMTRKKARQELSSSMTVECPYCKGVGRVLPAEAAPWQGLRMSSHD